MLFRTASVSTTILDQNVLLMEKTTRPSQL